MAKTYKEIHKEKPEKGSKKDEQIIKERWEREFGILFIVKGQKKDVGEIHANADDIKDFIRKTLQAQNQDLLEKIEEGIEKEIKDTFKWEEDYKRKGQHELAKVCNIQIGVYEEIKTLIKTLIK